VAAVFVDIGCDGNTDLFGDCVEEETLPPGDSTVLCAQNLESGDFHGLGTR
jgi:hypothetical protein